MSKSKSIESLFDRLSRYFHDDCNVASFEAEIKELQSIMPGVLRIIAQHMEETEPYAKNTIDAIKHTADSLEGIDIENHEDYWKLRERLGFS